MYMVTGWLPEKSGAARQRLREAEAEAGVEAGNSTAQNDEAGEVARLDSPHEEGSGEVPDGA
ncbi:unannotated protein [freshwater metagenome]